MPFSQQTYQGQGIVQQNVTPRAGELIGQGMMQAGQSIGQGLEKFLNRREEAKALRKELTDLSKFLPQGEKEAFLAEVETGSYGDLKGLQRGVYNRAAMKSQQLDNEYRQEQLNQLQQQGANQAALGKFMGQYMGASTPQNVTENIDFTSQISDTQNQLQQAQNKNRFIVGPEAYQFPGNSLLSNLASKPQQQIDYSGSTLRTQPSRDLALSLMTGAKTTETILPNMAISNAFKDAQMLTDKPIKVGERGQVLGKAGPEQMPQEPEEVTGLRNKLNELLIRQSSGETRTRQETPEEMGKRMQSFWESAFKENPVAAAQLTESLAKDRLSPSEQLAERKYMDEIQARTIPGFGVAPSIESAKEMRTLQQAYDQVNSGVGRLLEILDTPGMKTNLDLRAEAKTITGMLTGALRVPITGPGAFSDSEREMIEKIVRNPTAIFSLESTTRKALETLRNRIKDSRDNYAKTIGLQPNTESGPQIKTFDPSSKTFK